MGVAKRTAPMAWIVAVAAVANIGINLVAIPQWGIKAAALTTVLANVVMAAGSWHWSQRAYPIAYDWARILRALAIGCAVVAFVVLTAPGTGLGGILAATAGSIACGVLLLATVVSAEERERARGLVRRAARRVLGGSRRPQESIG
jgi:O-antigen/teichoic acid export membrane protein